MTKPMLSAEARASLLMEWLRQREEEMAALLSELVTIPTENPPGKNYRACTDFIEKTFQRVGLECERLEADQPREGSGEKPICLIASHGRGESGLYFHGHYDVVPAQSREQFKPSRKDHFLFGRGSCDMKGGISAMLYAILALKECGAELNGRIALTLVPNEETGGEGGSAWLAAQGRLGRGGVGVVLAGADRGVRWDAERGASLRLVSGWGRSARGGWQHQGENSFEKMVQVVQGLQELKRQVEQKTTGYNIGADQAGHSIRMLGRQSAGAQTSTWCRRSAGSPSTGESIQRKTW